MRLACEIVPFLSSIVTVSFAHFIRNLAGGQRGLRGTSLCNWSSASRSIFAEEQSVRLTLRASSSRQCPGTIFRVCVWQINRVGVVIVASEECLRACWCSILDGSFGLAALTQLGRISCLKLLEES